MKNKKYTVGTVPKSNQKIVERSGIDICTPSIHIYMVNYLDLDISKYQQKQCKVIKYHGNWLNCGFD